MKGDLFDLFKLVERPDYVESLVRRLKEAKAQGKNEPMLKELLNYARQNAPSEGRNHAGTS